jgi:hypothetical protein
MWLKLFACGATCLVLGIGLAKAQSCPNIPVCTLMTFNPDPSGNGSGTSGSPSCDTAHPPSSTQMGQMQAAWALAPNKVRADLCRITQFFIDPNTPGSSWGRWENPLYHTTIPGATQITVNANDLGNTFSQIQDNRLGMLKIDANFGKHSESVPSSVGAYEVGLLYVLTHELAHIRWHKEAFIGELPGCSDDPNFYSWNDVSSYVTRRWTNFDDEFDTHINTNVKTPKNVQSADDLKGIYNNGFVTALGSANPEEDFVDSYAVETLIAACQGCKFYIEIPSGSGNKIHLHDDRGNNELTKKFDCVYQKHINPNKF